MGAANLETIAEAPAVQSALHEECLLLRHGLALGQPFLLLLFRRELGSHLVVVDLSPTVCPCLALTLLRLSTRARDLGSSSDYLAESLVYDWQIALACPKQFSPSWLVTHHQQKRGTDN